MTSTLHLSRHRVDTFLVNEPLLPRSLRESAWAHGMAHPQGDRVGPPPGPPGPARLPQRGRAGSDAHPLQPHGGSPPPARRLGGARPTLPVGRSMPRRMSPRWRPG